MFYGSTKTCRCGGEMFYMGLVGRRMTYLCRKCKTTVARSEIEE